MAKEYSPFSPGVPVPLEFFVGREPEITNVVTHARKSVAQKTLERLFICGERGIGKSSLCRFAVRVVEEKDEVLGLHVFLGGVTSLEEMIRRIFERLLQESRDRNWSTAVKTFLDQHVREMGLFGISLKFDASDRDLSQAVNDFAPTLRHLLTRLSEHRKGLMIVLDDLNGLAGSAPFANWLKSLVDEIATARDPLPLTLVLVGLPERRRELIANQPSLDRVFDIIDIKSFNEEETQQFYQRAFDKVNVSVIPAAQDLLWRFSGGYPVFLHEIGDAVFKADTDGTIDERDARDGVFAAARVIGAKYIEPKVLDAIWSERYHGILRKMMHGPWPFGSKFSKADLEKCISPEEQRVLDNFLQKMKQLGVIQQEAALGRGHYRFNSELYALFFWLLANAEKKRA